jgi:nucleoside-diphosphate-sugar epimerase
MKKNHKNILVTGANGFIGQHLVKKLVEEGYTVKAFDISKPKDELSDKLDIEFICGDIEDAVLLKQITKGIDCVFHLAARLFVPDSWKNPDAFYRTNVIGTANIIEACRLNNCRLTFNSSYVYGEPDYLPIDENHPLKSYNPYSHSKLLAEEICNFYRKYYGFIVTVFRPFNVYGPGQKGIFIIPEIISQVLSYKQENVIVNDLIPKRDYLYVDDMIAALILSLDAPGDIYNIGSGNSISVEDIIRIVIKQSGIEKCYSSRNMKRDNEINNVVANIAKAKQLLNWDISTPFEEGVVRCIKFYRENIEDIV